MTTPFRSHPDWHLIARLLSHAFQRHAYLYLASIAGMIFGAAMTGLSAWLIRDVIDETIDGKDASKIYIIGISIALIFMARGILSYIESIFLSYAGNNVVAEMQVKIFNSILDKSIDFYASFSSSEIITKSMKGADAARRLINIVITTFVRDLFSVAALVVVMIFQQPYLSMIALVFGPIAFAGVNLLLRRSRLATEREFLSTAKIAQVVQETVFGIKIVKPFGLEKTMRNEMHSAIRDVENQSNTMAALEAATAPIMETLAGLTIAGTVVISGFLILQGGQSPGSIMSFITALLLANGPAKRLASTRVSLERVMRGVRLMYDIIDREPSLSEAPNAHAVPGGLCAVHFDRVSFSYTEPKLVLNDIDLSFDAGKMTALVGRSGSGKSTILSLILRLYDPTYGKILIGGQDIKHATFRSLREKIAYVSQDTFLFSGTIMDNIRLGREDASDDEIVAAAIAANAHDFIMATPQQYQTNVGENGSLFSGGQRQRISIARAMLRSAEIVLLDEATSALDAESEALFRSSLGALRVGRTTIVVAHRLSTVLQADEIVVLDAGRIVERGAHDELLKRQNGAYKKLYNFQLLH